MNPNGLVGLDFETYSGVDLPKHGLARYVATSSFAPLIVSVAKYDIGMNPVARTIDLTEYYENGKAELLREIEGRQICAHNAGFEREVLRAMGIDLPANCFIDSAVVARAVGAGSSLEAAAPQLLGTDKLEQGKHLIRLFSIPGEYQEKNGTRLFDRRIVDDNPDHWLDFKVYCEMDAILSLRLVYEHIGNLTDPELDYAAITLDMNRTGWPVDVATVEEMQRRYLENVEKAEAEFRAIHNAHDLNLNSLKQLKEWCLARGIRATSFDEQNVERLHARISKKLDSVDANLGTLSHEKYQNYCEVLALLETKQILGGSSLKKLQVILDTTSKDCRLRDQYLHCGAGQTWRTTGRSVQMQNLKRLGAEVDDMLELEDLDTEWDNEKLARNIRQCFTSSHRDGQLIVGDFSSVEARGLAWLAGDVRKLQAYRDGMDMYKVLASEMYGTPYEQVTKEQRQGGKVGVLSCGYQAGGGAVQAFAAKMHIDLSEAEATKLVADWRAANPAVVTLWDELDVALRRVVEEPHIAVHTVKVGPGRDFRVRLYRVETPASLLQQHPAAQSIVMEMLDPHGQTVLLRFFHGCYVRGNSICYYKPSERKTGDLWSSHFVDPKTKQVKFYSIYGGKLTGILTQSFCREIFFRCLAKVHAWCLALENVDLIGQFHDEIVLDWRPVSERHLDGSPIVGQIELEDAKIRMNHLMSELPEFPGFPLEADIKHDYRYTK